MPLEESPLKIVLTNAERRRLKTLSNSWNESFGRVMRARVVLWLEEGLSISEVSRRSGFQRRIVRKWAARFSDRRLDGLEDEHRSGRPPTFPPSGKDDAGESRLRVTGRRRPVPDDVDLF